MIKGVLEHTRALFKKNMFEGVIDLGGSMGGFSAFDNQGAPLYNPLQRQVNLDYYPYMIL